MEHVPQNDTNYHMRLLVDRVPSMLAYWDRDLRCRFANRAYERWFGIDPDSLIGTRMQDLLGPELYALNEPYVQSVLRGEAQLFDRIVPGPDGTQRHGLANYIPDVVEGRVIGFLVQVTEITALKAVQAALEREQSLRAQIEAHAQELRQLLHERSEMLDVLAHEVRQPLNNASAALQSAESALTGVSDGAAASRIKRAQVVMRRVVARLDNTLAVASLLARPGPVERTDCDIDTLISVAVADLPAAERARILLRRDTPTRTASMDMSLMRLALQNVLSNALRHGPPESPVVIRLSDSDEPLALVIDVIDRGCGVEASLVPRLFERGARSEQAGIPSGHGLGLYIVQRVMQLHGGRAELSCNTPGEVTMRLVLQQAAEG